MRSGVIKFALYEVYFSDKEHGNHENGLKSSNKFNTFGENYASGK